MVEIPYLYPELTDFPLDLVELERIETVHAESIRRNGRLVYERP